MHKLYSLGEVLKKRNLAILVLVTLLLLSSLSYGYLNYGLILSHDKGTADFMSVASSNTSQLGTKDWNQYHGNETHNGFSDFPGPMEGSLIWSHDVGGSNDGIISYDHELIVSHPDSPYILELSESNGSELEQIAVPNPSTCQTDSVGTSYPSEYGGFLYYEFFGWMGPCYSIGNNYEIVLAATLLSGNTVTYYESVAGAPQESPLYSWGMVTASNGYVFYAPYQGSILTSYLGISGEVNWQTNVTSQIDTIPTIGDNIIVIGYSNSNNVAGLSEVNGGILWNLSLSGNVYGTPSYGDGIFYVGTTNGIFYAINPNGIIAWSYNLKSPILTTASIANGLVYVCTSNGLLYALNAKNGTPVWLFNDGNPIESSPVVASNGVVYFADTTGAIYALNSTTGRSLWNYSVNSSIIASPVLDDGYLFVVGTNGVVYAFGNAYNVSFIENGLPTGTNWSITFDNISKKSDTGIISFIVPPGIFNFSVGTVLGYVAYPLSGRIAISHSENVTISFSPGWSLPSAPIDISAKGGIGNIILTWEPPISNGAPPGFNGSGIEAYYIYRSTSPGKETFYGRVNGTQTIFLDNNVVSGTVYFYVVGTLNPVGEGPLSLEVSAEPVTVSIPTPPQNLTAFVSDNGILLKFNPPASDGGSPVTQYVIYKGESPSTMLAFVTLSANDTSYLDKSNDLIPGQAYYYYVVAVNSVGTSNPSSTITAIAPKSLPQVPIWKYLFYTNINPGYTIDLWILIATLASIIVVPFELREYLRKRKK